MVPQNTSGVFFHTLEISSGLKVLYECMNTHELKLNDQNLSKYCGQNCKLVNFCVAGELGSNKVHEKN